MVTSIRHTLDQLACGLLLIFAASVAALAPADCPSPDTRPEVFAYVSSHCRPCQQLQKDVAGDARFRWIIVPETDWPAWVETKPKPVLKWRDHTGRWVQRPGWRGLADFDRWYAVGRRPK